MPKPSAGQNGTLYAWFLLAASAPTADSSTAATVKSTPRVVASSAVALPNSGQKISATPASPSAPPATKRAVSLVANKARAPSPVTSGDAEYPTATRPEGTY